MAVTGWILGPAVTVECRLTLFYYRELLSAEFPCLGWGYSMGRAGYLMLHHNGPGGRFLWCNYHAGLLPRRGLNMYSQLFPNFCR